MTDSGKQTMMSAEEFYQALDRPDIESSSWHDFSLKFAEAYASYREQANAERIKELEAALQLIVENDDECCGEDPCNCSSCIAKQALAKGKP